MTEEQKEQKTAFNQRIGQRTATLRKLAGMSQEQLSERAGLQRSHISRIEAGKFAHISETMSIDSLETFICDDNSGFELYN